MVVVGQILSAVAEYHLTITTGCVIVAIISYFVSLFGFKLIHRFEKYGWIPTVILFIVLASQIGSKVNVDIPAKVSGLRLAGAFLTFLGINFSSTSGWCSLASDYYVHFPLVTRTADIFWMTFFGVSIPTMFATIIGAALGNIAIASADLTPNPNAHLSEAFQSHKFGGLLLNAYYPTGFSKFALVILTFSVLGNNIAVNYSNGLSLQLLGHYFHAIPRFIWSFVNAITIAILAIVGRENLSMIIENFVSLLGYWTISFTLILLIEDQWFRKRLPLNGYQLAVWDMAGKLPFGVAAVLALLAGYLAGGVPGMAKPWYVGPIAAKFGPFGGDVGTWMSGLITITVYLPARWYEILKTGR